MLAVVSETHASGTQIHHKSHIIPVRRVWVSVEEWVSAGSVGPLPGLRYGTLSSELQNTLAELLRGLGWGKINLCPESDSGKTVAGLPPYPSYN